MSTTITANHIERHSQSPLLQALKLAGADVSKPNAIRCPFHEDDNASAGIYSDDAGVWRFKCHGCDEGGDVFDIRAKIEGKPVGDVLKAASNGQGHRGKIVATYNYTDAGGTLLYQVVRFEPKDFRQRRPDGDGGHVWNLRGVQRVLYHLPEIVEAGPDSFVFVVEGEKDADRMKADCMLATTCPQGAGKWDKCDLSPLHGRHVVLVPDNDAKGIEHMRGMAEALDGKAASVRVLQLPDLPDKGDVSDWFNVGHDGEELVRLAEDASEWTPDGERDAICPSGTDAPAEPIPHRLIMRRAADVLCRDIEWLWHNRFVAGGINLLCGMPDVGKSVLTVDLASRVSNGTPWPPIHGEQAPNTAGSVAFLSMEDAPETTIVPRLRAAGANLDKVFIIEGVERVEGKDKFRDAFDISRDIHQLEALRSEVDDLRLVIIDPLDSYLSAKLDTNIGNKVRAALWPLKDWAEATGITIIIVHHFNKSATTNAMDKVSGARSFGALPRSVWAVAREEGDDRTILAPVKLNLVKHEDKRAIAYTIRPSMTTPNQPAVVWHDEDVNTTAAELLGAQRNKQDDAADWLRDLLGGGPMDSKDVLEHAKQAGHSETTVRRAKDRAGVTVEQRREGDKITGWQWRL